jgi:hypothetical protein
MITTRGQAFLRFGAADGAIIPFLSLTIAYELQINYEPQNKTGQILSWHSAQDS